MNEINKFSLELSTSDFTDSIENDNVYIEPSNGFIFAIRSDSDLKVVSGKTNSYIENYFDILREKNDKEIFYIKAIKNLIKQKNFLNLNYQYSNDLISDEEYSNELEHNEDKYLIKINEQVTKYSYKTLTKIIHTLESDLSDDDVSEMFSIELNNISEYLPIDEKDNK